MSCHIQNAIAKPRQPIEIILLLNKLRNSLWFIGIPSWLFGITDRGVAAFADGYLSPLEILQIFTASLFFLSWLSLKPEAESESGTINLSASSSLHIHPNRQQKYLDTLQDRMDEIKAYHTINQEYILPFPYLCQIYHLLNLKHLETVHNFSLNNLKVTQVSDIKATEIGGVLKFQTILESPLNALRIWRQPLVEVELVLLTPYTVELKIPAYNDKKVVVLFNVVPLGENEHRFIIDIYTDLQWFKPILKFVFHIASCLTLFEDLPYLQALAESNLHRLVSLGKVSERETMWLFKRFIDLYGTSIRSSHQLSPAKEAQSLREI